MIYAGIDAGSRAIKIVLINEAKEIIGSSVTDQGVNQTELAAGALEGLLAETGQQHDDIAVLVATGYGRDSLAFADTTITEITCHARGVHSIHPEARTIIDIGGQDSKLIRLDDRGKVRDFVMNDRCAAGTGRFLEVVAQRLDIGIDHLGEYGARADNPAAISSMCVVFAETEIIGLLAGGAGSENIVAGVQNSIASRMASMAGRNAAEPILFTGGVAMIPGMDKALEKSLGRAVQIAETPQITGALGAALLARERRQEAGGRRPGPAAPPRKSPTKNTEDTKK